MVTQLSRPWFTISFAARIAVVALCVIGGCHAVAAEALRSRYDGDVHALIVGINDYGSVPKLEGSVGDAHDIASALGGAGVSDVRLLLDRQVTRTAFLAEILQLLDRSQPGDLAIITYSGHGASVDEYPQFKGLEQGGKTEEFIMADYGTSGAVGGGIIANKEVKALLARFDQKGVDVLFVADSCFGGGMIRGLPDARVGLPPLRFLRDAEPGRPDSFSPIAMTKDELRVDVGALSHVTFLSGSDRFTPVPEVFIPAPPLRRGALSYVFARAISGSAADIGQRVLTRRQLFSYARQEVQHYSDDQRIETVPEFGAPSPILDKPVLRWKYTSEDSNRTIMLTGAQQSSSDCEVVRISIINTVSKPVVPDAGIPVALSSDPQHSDLVWDVQSRQVIQASGDVVAGDVDKSRIAEVIRRTSAINCIRTLMNDRPQVFRLRGGSKNYSLGDTPIFDAENMTGRYIVVFNIAADGRIQVLYPTTIDRPMTESRWSGSPPVVEPFGTDYAIAMTSSSKPSNFLAWLDALDDSALHGGLGELVNRLRRMQIADPTTRLGAVALYTSAK